MPNFITLFFGLPNLLSHFNQLLSKKVLKLLVSYGNLVEKEHTFM